MANTIFESDATCLFCDRKVAREPTGAGWACDDEDGCGAHYFASGVAAMESIPDWYVMDGEVAFVQESNNGMMWHWCGLHEELEPDNIFGERPCPGQIAMMTPLLSG